MRPHEIENWALNVIGRIRTGKPVEDSTVEVKAGWTPAKSAARRIAGHANAARGAPILWLVGVDEKRGVVGARHEELADWWGQVKAEFDGPAPRLTDCNVPVEDATVVALLFETDRVPFVVRNPVYGKPGGGSVEREVPWREGTSIRSATRSDLVRLLSPLQSLPSFEILGATLTASKRSCPEDGRRHVQLEWLLRLKVYQEVVPEVPIVIPFHRCSATFEVRGVLEETAFEEVELSPPRISERPGRPAQLLSLTIGSTPDEVVISGPGKLELRARGWTPAADIGPEGDALVRASCQPVDADHRITLDLELSCVPPQEREQHRWELVSGDSPRRET